MTPPCALVLAAGRSTRMGTCKTALPWIGGQPLLTYQLHQLLAAGFAPTAVLGSHNFHQQTLCPPGVQIVLNPNSELGKTSSILAGLAALGPTWQTLLISAVDQPRSSTLYQTLLLAHQSQQAAITLPSYQGRWGHPLLFDRGMQPALTNIQESTQGLRQVLQNFSAQVQIVAVTSSEVLQDLNTPERYQAAYAHSALCL